ncbi:unnamed protein product [Calicophoron daubneyi]|uniref:Uncharacterized protein n=1 Tax=Calicophoron daubneyi TaxID=300641 RepID=A0AAV2THU5_CALDB
MERLSNLITLCSQPSQLPRTNVVNNLLKELKRAKNVPTSRLREVIRCLGGSFNQSHGNNDKLLDPLLQIAELCFKKAMEAQEVSSDSLLKSVLDDLLEPMSLLSADVAYTVAKRFLAGMLEAAGSDSLELVGRFDVITALNLLLSRIPGALRKRLWHDTESHSRICEFGSKLRELGDFDLQAHAAALLLRLVPHKYHENFAESYIIPERTDLAVKFANVGGVTFESEIRTFLNALNCSCHDHPKVISISAVALRLCELELEYPTTPGTDLKSFWLDFNVCTERITIYCLALHGDSSTQISGLATQSQSDWEILTIYPELVDVLEIKKTDDTKLSLNFTMTEPICDICDWASSVKGNNIEIDVLLDALHSDFLSLNLSVESGLAPKYSTSPLCRILQQLQEFCFKLQEGKNVKPAKATVNTQAGCTSVIASPILLHIDEVGSEPVLSQNILEATALSSTSLDVKNASSKWFVARSPILCADMSQINGDRPTSEGDVQAISKDSIIRNDAVQSVITAVSSPGACKASPYIDEISGHAAENDSDEEHIHTSNHPGVGADESKTVNLPFASDSQTEFLGILGDYTETPEKQRRKPTCLSPMMMLPTRPPLIENPLEAPRCLPTLSPGVLGSKNCPDFEGPVHGPADQLPITPVISENTPKKLDSEPPSVSLKVSSVPPSTELHDMLSCANSVTALQTPPNVSRLAPLSAASLRSCRTPKSSKTSGPNSSGRSKQKSRGLVSSQFDASDNCSSFSSSLDSTPTAILNAFVGSRFLSSSNMQLTAKAPGRPPRKLCDTSTSYLLDISPANVNLSLTPTDGTTNFPKPPADEQSDDTSGSSVSESDSDYRPPVGQVHKPTPSTERRSLRSDDAPKVILSPLKSTTPAEKPQSGKRPAGTPKRSRMKSGPPIPPVSSLKKKRFFSSRRTERIDREKKRFEEACKNHFQSNSKPGKRRSRSAARLRTSPANVKNQSSTSAPKRILPTSNMAVPTLARAISVASAPLAMPTDSDTEFTPDISDSQNSHTGRLTHSKTRRPFKPLGSVATLTTVPETSQCLDSIPPSWLSSDDCAVCTRSPRSQDIKSPSPAQDTRFVMDSSSDDLSLVDINSNAPSLFALTPPASRGKLLDAKKHHSPLRIKPVPLDFLRSGVKECDVVEDKEVHADTLAGSVATFDQFALHELQNEVMDNAVDLNVSADGGTNEFVSNAECLHQTSFECSPVVDEPVILCEPDQMSGLKSPLAYCEHESSFTSLLQRLSLVSERISSGCAAHRRLEKCWLSIQKDLENITLEVKALKERQSSLARM